MPVNLPDQAKAKWAAAQATREPATKLRLLREFYSSFPKHKGTERMQVALKRQIKRLEEDAERARTHRTGSARLEWVVKKEEFLQLAVVGTLPTACAFFAEATALRFEPHQALQRPIVGMLRAARVAFQLVLAPFDPTIGEEKQERLLGLMRGADGLLVILGFEPDQYLADLTAWFEHHNIDVLSEQPRVVLVVTATGGLRITGASPHIDDAALRRYLRGYRMTNGIVRLTPDATLDDIESALFGREHKPAVFVVLPGRRFESWPAEWPQPSLAAQGLDTVGLRVLQRLDLIRIFTKGVGQAPVERPVLVPRGEHVIDVASQIHKDFAKFFNYARVWRAGAEPIRVGRHFPLEDGDLLELHAT